MLLELQLPSCVQQQCYKMNEKDEFSGKRDTSHLYNIRAPHQRSLPPEESITAMYGLSKNQLYPEKDIDFASLADENSIYTLRFLHLVKVAEFHRAVWSARVQ